MGGEFCCGNAEADAQASGLAASLLSFGKPAFILNFSAAMRTFSLFLFAPAVYLLTIDSIAARAAGVSIDDRMSSASASPPRLADSEGSSLPVRRNRSMESFRSLICLRFWYRHRWRTASNSSSRMARARSCCRLRSYASLASSRTMSSVTRLCSAAYACCFDSTSRCI